MSTAKNTEDNQVILVSLCRAHRAGMKDSNYSDLQIALETNRRLKILICV